MGLVRPLSSDERLRFLGGQAQRLRMTFARTVIISARRLIFTTHRSIFLGSSPMSMIRGCAQYVIYIATSGIPRESSTHCSRVNLGLFVNLISARTQRLTGRRFSSSRVQRQGIGRLRRIGCFRNARSSFKSAFSLRNRCSSARSDSVIVAWPGSCRGFECGHPPPQRSLVNAEFPSDRCDRSTGVDDELYSLVFVLRSELPTCPCHDEHSLL